MAPSGLCNHVTKKTHFTVACESSVALILAVQLVNNNNLCLFKGKLHMELLLSAKARELPKPLLTLFLLASAAAVDLFRGLSLLRLDPPVFKPFCIQLGGGLFRKVYLKVLNYKKRVLEVRIYALLIQV